MCRKLWLTCCAEAFGTGVLGGIAAYPVAKLLMGLNPTGLFVYIVPFLVSTVVGSILAYVLISALEKGGALNQIPVSYTHLQPEQILLKSYSIRF